MTGLVEGKGRVAVVVGLDCAPAIGRCNPQMLSETKMNATRCARGRGSNRATIRNMSCPYYRPDLAPTYTPSRRTCYIGIHPVF